MARANPGKPGPRGRFRLTGFRRVRIVPAVRPVRGERAAPDAIRPMGVGTTVEPRGQSVTRHHARARRRLNVLRRLLPAALCGVVALGGSALLGRGDLINSAATAGPARIELPRRKPSPHVVEVAAASMQGRPMAGRARTRETTLEVGPGDTMMALLQSAGVGRSEAFRAVSALKAVYSPRDLKPGQQIRLALTESDDAGDSDGARRLARLRLRASAEEDVRLRRDPRGDFVAESLARDLSRRVDRVRGRISASLFADGERAGIPVPIMLQMIHGFSYAVDFQRDLQKGDSFETLYETYHEAGGALAKVGELLYARLKVQGERLEMYRFERDDGEAAYFNAKGESVRRLLMRTPVNGARLSSGYGMRKHPILGYSRMHRGVDFAAPPGTPIYAAGSGVVEYAGRNGGYGNYVRIRHNGAYKTAYAHLRGFAKGVHGGARVSQGDVIGYIGSTGTSTGPHLHYEILVEGEQVNPRALELPTGYRLKGHELARFKQVKATIDRLRQGREGPTRLARRACREQRPAAASAAAC